MALSEFGCRWIHDRMLDQICPLWREYMMYHAKVPAEYAYSQQAWNGFIRGQMKRYEELGLSYPRPQDIFHLSVEFESDTSSDEGEEEEGEEEGEEEEEVVVEEEGEDEDEEEEDERMEDSSDESEVDAVMVDED